VISAFEFENTPWIQRTLPEGLSVNFASITRRSWLSRGRKMGRCSLKMTGRR
jgi:hypothetical protein